MLGVRLFLLQRVSAVILAPLVIVHLIVIVYAVRGGLDADEILARTNGSLVWGGFYGLFVVAVSVHAAIGLRVVMHELLRVREPVLSILTWLLGLACLMLGARAVVAVVM